MRFKFHKCECITEDMVASLREDPTDLSPSLATCLHCLPVTCRGVPVDTLTQSPIRPSTDNVTLGDLLTGEWCAANGMIRARAPKGTETLLVQQPSARDRYILRQTAEGPYLVWDNPDDPANVQQRLASLPAGTDRTVVGESVYTIYMVREIGGKLCLLTPDSLTPWQDRRIHAQDRLVLFGNENIRADLLRGCQMRTRQTPKEHDDLFLVQCAKLRNRETMGVQRVLRLR